MTGADLVQDPPRANAPLAVADPAPPAGPAGPPSTPGVRQPLPGDEERRPRPGHDPQPPGPGADAARQPDPRQPDPRQGVIEEARRRQRARRRRISFAALVLAGLVGTVAWALIEASGTAPAHAHPHGGPLAPAADLTAERSPVWDVRLAPALEVGQAGWQIFVEEHGAQAGGSVNGPAVSSDPIIVSDSASDGGSHVSATRVITTPNVAAILVEGKTRIATVALPGLPYGYRGARILTPIDAPEERRAPGARRVPPGMPPGLGPRSLVPLDARGQPIDYRPSRMTPFQGKVRSWEYPGPTPQGSCGLRAGSVPGLTARGGTALAGVHPYPAGLVGGHIVGHAFFPCVSVEYDLRGVPLRGLILLDAAHPASRAAALPDFKQVPGAHGFFDEGGITATRRGRVWLVAAQGRGAAERVRLLRHLTPLVSFHALVAASSGAPEAGRANAPPPPVPPSTVRVAPALEAGELGWSYTERQGTGRAAGGGGSCCGALTRPAQLLSYEGRPGLAPWKIATVIAAPEVAAVSVEGRAPVRTRSGGLPYGMRFAVLPVKHGYARVVAYTANARRITAPGFQVRPKRRFFEGPYSPHRFTAPALAPAGPCELSAAGLTGLVPVSGAVVLRVKGYRLFESRAFQSCASTYLSLGGATLEAAVLLDAEHPGRKPAPLPYMKPAAGITGVFRAPAGLQLAGGRGLGPPGGPGVGGGSETLTAERLAGAWLVVTGGSDSAQQLEVLRHVHATVHL